MANLGYRGIDLSIVHTRSVAREAIYTDDGTTLLWQKWTIDVDTVYNPAATSFDPSLGIVGNFGVGVQGQFPPQTDSAIRQTLLQPQGLLRFTDEDGRVILRSPFAGYTVDAKNGPQPQVCEVTQISGTKTWRVHFKIVTYVNECPKVPGPYRAGGAPVDPPPGRNPLLSHRWKRYMDSDEDHFATLVTVGRCIFRADELVRLGQFPDQFRQQLFHAIPQNFRRHHIQVAPSEDGTMVDYQVTDVETAMNFNDPDTPNATRIEAFQTASYAEPNVLGEIGHAFGGTASAIIGAASIDPVASLAKAAAASLSGGINLMARLLPQYSVHVICRVWGNRNSRRPDLLNTALGVCIARMGNNPFQVVGRSSETIITQEITGKFVEVQMTVKWGPERLAALALEAVVNNPVLQAAAGVLGFGNLDPAGVATSNPVGIGGILSFFPQTDDLAGVRTVAGVQVAAPKLVVVGDPTVANYPPPNSGGTRGTWVGQLVAQALALPCTIPPRPPIAGPIGVGINAKTLDLTLYP